MLSQPVLSNTNSLPTKRLDLISLQLSIGTYNQAMDWIIDAAHRHESRSVCFANVHMAVEVKQSAEFANVVNGADWVAADGVPLVWGLRGLYGQQQDRIAGMDMLPDLLKRAVSEKLSVFFYGSTPDVLDRTKQACERLYPGVQIAGMISPPFRPLTVEEESVIAKRITDSGANLVFVALGCPKQEQWMARMRNHIPAVLLGIGGALPVLAGEQKRAPEWMQNLGMEWVFRLAQEPRRLFKRYAVTNSLYVWHVGKQWISQLH